MPQIKDMTKQELKENFYKYMKEYLCKSLNYFKVNQYLFLNYSFKIN